MLKELFIDNYVIIKRQHIYFEEGFNVLSGETGSGKSLILDSINLLLGKRADKDAIGKFADKTIVEGVFEVDDDLKKILMDMDISFDDNKLIITRTISKSSSSIRINSRISSLALLKEIAPLLIDVYNQGDSNSFMNKKNYLNIIDSYGRDQETIILRKKIKELYNKKKSLIDTYEKFDLTQEEVQREKDLIIYQINEIEEINLDKIDEEKIDSEYKKLNAVTEISEAMERSEELISSYDFDRITISNLLANLINELSSFTQFDEAIENLYESASLINEQVDNLYSDIDSYREGLDQDPQRLEELENIIQKIFNLKRKYGNSFEEIKNYYDKISKRYEELEDLSDLRKNINKRIGEIDKELEKNSQNLHEIRLNKSKDLEIRIKDEIQSLNIVNGKFKIDFKKSDSIGESGFDQVDFLIRTNKGEALKSLSKTASGGEVSRIMLSFKKVFADFDNINTMIFDEIDQGISGRTAQIVGEKILDLSKDRQIIAISHLPQIASLSNNHILIIKSDENDYTVSISKTIQADERTAEIARLIGGVDITETTMKSAREMLEMAKELRDGK